MKRLARTAVSAVAALGLLLTSGCASADNRAHLEHLQQDCTAGVQEACQQIPAQEAINHDEAVANGFKAAAIVVLLPILALGAAAAARNEPVAPPQCYNGWRHVWYYC